MFSEWSLVNGAGCKFTSRECHLSKQPLGRKGCGISEKSESAKLPLIELLDSRLCWMESGGREPWTITFSSGRMPWKGWYPLGWNSHQLKGAFCFSVFLCVSVSMDIFFVWLVFFVLLSLMDVKDWTFALGSGGCLWRDPHSGRSSVTAISLPRVDCKPPEDRGHTRYTVQQMPSSYLVPYPRTRASAKPPGSMTAPL